jgi:hypothetical protein
MADALRRQRDTFGPRHDLTAAAAALIERAQAQHPALAGHALSPSTLILEMNEPGALRELIEKVDAETIQIVTPPCPSCGATSTVEVPVGGFTAWKQGELIQRALPGLTKDQRETLMTGFHPACWNKVFGS